MTKTSAPKRKTLTSGFLKLALTTLALTGLSLQAQAQDWPKQSIKFVTSSILKYQNPFTGSLAIA